MAKRSAIALRQSSGDLSNGAIASNPCGARRINATEVDIFRIEWKTKVFFKASAPTGKKIICPVKKTFIGHKSQCANTIESTVKTQ